MVRPMEKRRITQQDVARKAGVHRATVSMVFRGHPNIPAGTRERILRIAAELGYEPDPMLSALAAYRNRHRPAGFHGTLAWLVNSAFDYDWQLRPHFVGYHEGARVRALRHGYRMDVFDLNQPGLSPERAASILRARNITGILLCPQPRSATTFVFPWQHFSAVTFGYSLSNPRLHTVAATQYRAMIQVVQEVRRLGYRRLGLVLHDEHDRRTDHNYFAGFLVGQRLAGGGPELPPLGASYDDVEAVRAWLKAHSPDAVITCNYQFLDTLTRLGIRVPRDLGVACPVLPTIDARMSGVAENNQRIGAVAVDFLVAMIQRGERGVPESAERIHVEGCWVPGRTLRARR
jgi:LacI family transcriptional regulator/LacI family repressor for deo operon, udp, cdd, tsx, nupC, and nupG